VSLARDEDDGEVREPAREESDSGVEDVGGRQPHHGDAERGDSEDKRGRRRRRGRRGGRNREGREHTARAREPERGVEQVSPDVHPAGDWNGHADDASHGASSPQAAADMPREARRDEPAVAASTADDEGLRPARARQSVMAPKAEPPHYAEPEPRRRTEESRTPEPAHSTDADRFGGSDPVHTPSPTPTDEAAQPTRKGWWQKRFGSG
jgi:ribonuclease E